MLLCRYRPSLPLVLCGLSFKVEPGGWCTKGHTNTNSTTVSTLLLIVWALSDASPMAVAPS